MMNLETLDERICAAIAAHYDDPDAPKLRTLRVSRQAQRMMSHYAGFDVRVYRGLQVVTTTRGEWDDVAVSTSEQTP